jgi:phage gp36-like protein
MAFATAQDMLDRIDSRWLCDLILDDGTAGTEAEFLASTRVAAVLDDAAGIILAYALQGGRYTEDDLDDLTGASLSLLVRLNVDLASALLAEARQVPVEDVEKTIPGYGRTLKFLEQLQLGNVIFNVQAAIDAGSPKLAYNVAGYMIPTMERYFGDVNFTDKQANRDLPAPEGA